MAQPPTPSAGLFSNIRGDLFGGLTAGIVALPLALAFGEQTELGAIAGLYGAIAIGILAAIFGGTPTQISGPTAPMTVVSAVVITTAMQTFGSLDEALPVIFATFFAAGVIQVALGLLGVGKYVRYIPYPVVSGFMSGIGVIIVVTQLFPFVGAEAPSGGALGTVKALRGLREVANGYSILVAVIAIALIYLTPRVTKLVPGALIALLVLTPMVLFLFPEGAVEYLGGSIQPDGTLSSPLPVGLPTLQFGLFGGLTDFSRLGFVLQYGGTLAALGAIDSLLTSVVADNITRTKHDSRRELIGQGIGNAAASFIGGLPGAGATVRTVVNANAGGRTRLSGIIAGLLLLTVLLGLGGLVGFIPNAVLAGILITVGIGIIDYKGLRHLTKVSKADGAVLILVLALTVFVDLLTAVGVGMVLASLLFMKRQGDLVEESSGSRSLDEALAEEAWDDETDALADPTFRERVFVKHLDGPLFFGFASSFRAMVKALPQVDVVIIRLGRVPYVDQTGLYALEDAILELERRGITVLLTGLREQPRDMLEGIGLVGGLVAREHTFGNFQRAYDFLDAHIRAGQDFSALRQNVQAVDVREA